MCQLDVSEIIAAKDPVCMFFAEIGKAYQGAADYRRKMQISEKVFSYLASFDKCIAVSLAETAENTMKMFSMIAIIILHCSQIVYAKVYMVENRCQGSLDFFFLFSG